MQRLFKTDYQSLWCGIYSINCNMSGLTKGSGRRLCELWELQFLELWKSKSFEKQIIIVSNWAWYGYSYFV